MGLFVTEDGYFQGWLAALLCCCAAFPEDGRSIEKQEVSKPTASRNTICNEQPSPLHPMPLIPVARTRNYNKGGQSAFDEHDRVRPISERPPSLKPLDFGETSLLDRMSLHTRQKSSTTLMNRISIGKPLDFRRLEYTEKQRRSLIPLQLGPVVLKKEPNQEPDHELQPTSSSFVDHPTDSPRNPYRVYRGTLFERPQQLNSIPPSPTASSQARIVETAKEHKASRPVLSTQSSSSSLRSLRHQAIDPRHSASSGSSRNSFERIRLKRKRSGLKTFGEIADQDVDREILELNTIVEERRAETTRTQSAAHQHVPAVAPRMPVRARSETLTDIGSAFSKPFTSTSTLDEASETTASPAAETPSSIIPTTARLSRPFESMPDPGIEQSTQQHIRRPGSRVAGWLSNLFSVSNSASTQSSAQEPFQTCLQDVHHRAVSETSLGTTISEMGSLVATSSSPMSKKSHSRTLTAESRITPASPLSTIDGSIELEPKSRISKPWPVSGIPPNQVGLAL